MLLWPTATAIAFLEAVKVCLSEISHTSSVTAAGSRYSSMQLIHIYFHIYHLLRTPIKAITLFVKHHRLSLSGTSSRNVHFIKKWPHHQEMATSSKNVIF